MIIHENMTTDQPICVYDVEWVGTLYSQMIKAATVSNLDEVRECMEWCTNVQSQVIDLVKCLSVDEGIHRELDSEDKAGGLEFVEKDYTKLIDFVSGVGVAVSEMSDRLRATKQSMQHEQYKTAQKVAANTAA